jgi:hypothetical protein
MVQISVTNLFDHRVGINPPANVKKPLRGSQPCNPKTTTFEPFLKIERKALFSDEERGFNVPAI